MGAPLLVFLAKDVPAEGFMVARTQRWSKAFNAMVSTLLPPFAMGVAGALGWWFARF